MYTNGFNCLMAFPMPDAGGSVLDDKPNNEPSPILPHMFSKNHSKWEYSKWEWFLALGLPHCDPSYR